MRHCWALYTRHIIDIVINSAPNRQQGAGASPGVGESKGKSMEKTPPVGRRQERSEAK